MFPTTRKANLVLVLFWSSLTLAVGSRAEVKLPDLISDGMVLQQGMEVTIWGTADPGELVTVTLNNQQVAGRADSRGQWKVSLSPFSAGGPYSITIAGKNTLTLHDVLIGEVWVCSGQSNMEMTVGPGDNTGLYSFHSMPGVNNYADEVAHADYPLLRLFTVEKAVASKPQNNIKGYWTTARPQSVNDFSAVGYFFGRELLKALNIPVRLIHSSWGGTIAEAWMSRGALQADPEFSSVLTKETGLLLAYPRVFRDFEQQFAAWKRTSEDAETEGRPISPPPRIPYDPRQNPNRPSVLYNAMIAPLTSYAIKGVIWYQGESNGDHPDLYRKLFPGLIHDWRSAWREGDFPFLYVQLPNWGVEGVLDFMGIREAQLLTLSVPKTGMAVTIDIGDAGDIHPKNKQEVGYRLALAAEGVAYGRDIMYSGPIYHSMSIEGDKIRLRFKHVYNGLMTKNWTAPILIGFEIASENKKFLAAQATIEGDTILVRSDAVPHPVAVRYAWKMNPFCNLYNRAGLPASPFRTDNW